MFKLTIETLEQEYSVSIVNFELVKPTGEVKSYIGDTL